MMRAFTLGLATLASACTAPVQSPPLTSNPTPPISQPTENADFRPATLSDMEGAWQVEMRPGLFEVFAIELDDRDMDADGTLDGSRLEYEGPDFDQAGWRQLKVEADGTLVAEPYRGPGLSARPFEGDRPFHAFLIGGEVRVETDGTSLRFRSGVEEVVAKPHPAEALAAPEGFTWVLRDYPFADQFDPADHTVPPFSPELSFEAALEAALAAGSVGFGQFGAGVRAGCNGGGTAFAQTDTAFQPLSGVIMTQMGCGDGGLADAVASSLVREGPPFVREGDRLYRDFPEGRMSFVLAPTEPR